MTKTFRIVLLSVVSIAVLTIASNFPQVALGQVVSGGRISITLSDSATTFTGTAASGSNAFAVSTNGARVDVGEGANDYFSSNGTTITTPRAFAATGGVTGALTGNASTATALASNPTDCSAGQYANAIAASGNLTCGAVAVAEVTGAAPLASPVFTTQITTPQVVTASGGLTIAPAATTGTACYVNAASGFSGKLLSLAIDGVEKFNIDNGGTISTYSTVSVANGIVIVSNANTRAEIRGNANNGASAIGVFLDNTNALSTAGARALVVSPTDSDANSVLNVYAAGGLGVVPSALPTCGATGTPEGTIVMVAGVTTTPTKMCVCTYTPTGTVYAWVNALANNAGTGIGDTTTCP